MAEHVVRDFRGVCRVLGWQQTDSLKRSFFRHKEFSQKKYNVSKGTDSNSDMY